MTDAVRLLAAVVTAVFCTLPAPQAGSRQQDAGAPAVLPVTHSEFREMLRKDSGFVVLVNAWATWCKPCTEEMPGVLQLAQKHRTDRFKVVLLSADDRDSLETSVKPFLRRNGVTFETYLMSDSSDDAFIRGMNPEWSGALPTSFLYDRNGSLVKMLVGERTFAQLDREVAALLRGG